MNDNGDKSPSPPRRIDTRVVTAGRDPPSYHGLSIRRSITPRRALSERRRYVAHRGRYQYGRRGTPTTEALESALMELEGPHCAGVALLPSGLAAISTALLAVVKAGDHLLVTDSAYGPTRNFCEQILPRFGVKTSYYDPLIGADIAALFKPQHACCVLESPGSQSFEMQDIPAIAEGRARQRRARADGQYLGDPALFPRRSTTASTSSIQAGTKYIGGHSDVMLGTVSANAAHVAALKQTTLSLRPVRRPRRRLSWTARPAHARGAA